MRPMTRAACTLLLGVCLPLQVLANALIPSDRWIERVAVKQALVPYKLGLVSVDSGAMLATELPAAVRTVLKQAGYVDNGAAGRVHVDMSVRSSSGGVAEVEYLMRRGPAGAADAIVYRKVIRSATANLSMADENTDIRVLAGNVKLFALDFRKHFDPAFGTQAAELVADVNEEVDSRGILSHVGEGAMNTLVATVEGTAAVAGTLGEVAASEEFHRGLSQAAGEYQRAQQQVAYENARLASAQAAAAREREARVERERAARQAERNEQLAANARWAAAKEQEAAQYRQAQSDKAEQRRAELDRQRQAAEDRQRQARADAQQRAAERQRAADEQARQRIADQRRAEDTRGHLIVMEQKRKEEEKKRAEAPRVAQQPSPAPEFSLYMHFPSTPKNLNCNQERECRVACPKDDRGVHGACIRACTARSTCKVSLQ